MLRHSLVKNQEEREGEQILQDELQPINQPNSQSISTVPWGGIWSQVPSSIIKTSEE